MSQPELVFVAGGSSDIGVALIERLLEASSDVRVVAHHHATEAPLTRLRGRFGDRLQTIGADFSSTDAVAHMAEQLVARFGLPTQLVYLPGLKLRYERFSKFDLAHFDRDMTVQLRSAVVLLKQLAPKMSKLARARIVFVLSSVTRGIPPKFMSMYSIVKHAQLGLMRSLASEYEASGLTVNAVCPSMVQTRFLDDIPDVARQMAAAAAPSGRLATPQEVAGAIELLLSSAAGGSSAAEVPVPAVASI
jgi:3-oxoacyl-[acyl-carrier protein] reductase